MYVSKKIQNKYALRKQRTLPAKKERKTADITSKKNAVMKKKAAYAA